MALPAKGTKALLALSKPELESYFMDHARYRPDAPLGQGSKYAIRAGGITLFDDDTMLLKKSFVAYVQKLQRDLRRQTKQPTEARND